MRRPAKVRVGTTRHGRMLLPSRPRRLQSFLPVFLPGLFIQLGYLLQSLLYRVLGFIHIEPVDSNVKQSRRLVEPRSEGTVSL
jgi:hypothetical protein